MIRQVFLIEENKLLCSMVEMSLKKEGIGIYTLQDPKDCLYLIEDINPDTLLLDLKTLFRNNQNKSFFQELGDNPKTCHIPILGLGNKEDLGLLGENQRFLRGLLPKPLSPTHLGQKILSLLENRPFHLFNGENADRGISPQNNRF